MHRIWGITWRPGDRSGSFLGKLFRPLGSPLMMVQVSHSPEEGRGGISLFGVAAEIHVRIGAVSYDRFLMQHDFHRLPFVGAQGRTLDPSDDRRGERSNGSWVRLALDVDRARHRALSRGLLATTPLLPEVFFGYHQKQDAPFEMTPALRRRVCMGNTPADAGHFSAAVATAREQAFSALSEEAQAMRLREAWEEAFLPPTDPLNSTGFWLLPQELSRNVFATRRIFEFFGELTGAHIFNPARGLGGRMAPNPAVEVAKEAGIDLVGDLGMLANTTEGAAEFQQIEERLIELVPAYRQRLGASAALSDQELLNALCHYDQPVAIEPACLRVPKLSRFGRCGRAWSRIRASAARTRTCWRQLGIRMVPSWLRDYAECRRCIATFVCPFQKRWRFRRKRSAAIGCRPACGRMC